MVHGVDKQEVREKLAGSRCYSEELGVNSETVLSIQARNQSCSSSSADKGLSPTKLLNSSRSWQREQRPEGDEYAHTHLVASMFRMVLES